MICIDVVPEWCSKAELVRLSFHEKVGLIREEGLIVDLWWKVEVKMQMNSLPLCFFKDNDISSLFFRGCVLFLPDREKK